MNVGQIETLTIDRILGYLCDLQRKRSQCPIQLFIVLYAGYAK